MRKLLSIVSVFMVLSLSAQKVHVSEDFNNRTLPSGWTNVAITGSQNWTIDTIVSGGLNGSSFAFFDDDALGGSSINNTATLSSPSFDNASDSLTYLEFDYNFRQINSISDSFFVEVFDGTLWQRVLSVGTDDCGNWRIPSCLNNFPHARIDISSLANANCQVRFTYDDGDDWGWYVGVDNVEIWSPYEFDLSIKEVVQGNVNCNTLDSLRIKVLNSGTKPVSAYDLGYSVNNGSVNLQTINRFISPLDSFTFTFSNPASFNLGSNTISVFVNLSNDQEKSNDSLNASRTISPSFNLPYFEDFEIDTGWMVSGLNPSWEIGIPSTSVIDTASGGKNILSTNLSGNYNNNELSYITSPCLSVGSNTNTVRISFDLINQTEAGIDQMWLEYSTDNGISWQKILEDTSAYSNWYNDQQKEVFTGDLNSNPDMKYLRISNQIRGLSPNSDLIIRFVFKSNTATTFQGVGIDNLMLNDFDEQDILIEKFYLPSNTGICGFDSANVSVQLINLSNEPKVTAELVYQVNSGTLVRDSLIDSLAIGSRYLFTFSQAFNFSNLNRFQIKSWITSTDDNFRLNDTAHVKIQNPQSTSFSLPYYEDFDKSQSLSPGWSVIAPSTWTAVYSTPSLNVDATGQNFMLGFNGPTIDETAGLSSPCLDLSGVSKPILYFKQGQGSDPLIIDLFDGNSWQYGYDTLTTNNFIFWKGQRLDLNRYSNRTIKLKFRSIFRSFSNNAYLDDIRILNSVDSPLHIENLKIDSSNCVYGATPTVLIKLNKHLVERIPSDSLWFEMKLNGVSVARERFPSGLNADVIDTNFIFNFRPSLNQIGSNEIRVIASLSLNGSFYTDSLSDSFITKIDQLPYEQGFEELFIECYDSLRTWTEFDQSFGWTTSEVARWGWHVTDTTSCSYASWQGLGGVGFSGPKTSFDSSAFMHLRLPESLFDRTLYTPCFDLSTYNQAELEYWYHRYANANMGILMLEVNHNGQWIMIDRIDTVFATQNSAWQRSRIDVSPYLGSSVQFRYRIDSLPTINATNTAIDAFRIYDPLATNLEQLETQTPTLSIYPNPNNGQFTIQVPEKLIGVQYQLIDLSGKTLKNSTFKRSTEAIEIDAEKGVYILQVPGMGINEKIVVY